VHRSAAELEQDTAALLRSALHRVVDVARAELRRRANGGQPTDPASTQPAGPPFHAWGIDRVVQELGVDPAVGLDVAEAEARRLVYGPNVLAGIEPRSAVAIVAGQVLTVPTAVLAAAALLSALLGDLLEAGAIGAVVGTNVAIGYYTEARAEELLHAWGELRAERARILREGREVEIPAAQVVPGTVLVLRAGEAIPADARVLAAEELTADESTLTGESEPSEKQAGPSPEDAPVADRDGMVYAGTVIA
jgi:Ca2+-transporting ATPase